MSTKTASLNRFPLFGLWNKVAISKIGPYDEDEAKALGHARAVLYAYRASNRGGSGKSKTKTVPLKVERKTGVQKGPSVEAIHLCGDTIEVIRQEDGRVQGFFGAQRQTAETYARNVTAKFPEGYYALLEAAFDKLLSGYKPAEINSRMPYDIYDQWKKSCKHGWNRVDLDALLQWCSKRSKQRRIA